jgi:hypothetical protein
MTALRKAAENASEFAIAKPVTADSVVAAVRAVLADQWAKPVEDSVRLAIVVARHRGLRLFRLWEAGPDGLQILHRAVERALAEATASSSYPDVLQIEVGFRPVPVTAAGLSAMGRAQMGRKGLVLLEGDQVIAVGGGSEMIAANRTFPRALAQILELHKLPADSVATGRVKLGLFESLQSLAHLTDEPRIDVLWRGNRIVEAATVDAEGIRDLADKMILWMHNQVGDDGRMVYTYFPSPGQESPADNSIRQAMATVCLNRIALGSGRAPDRDLADRNLQHILRTRYRTEGACGYIAEGEVAKLGAAALVALAILENPAGAEYREPFDALSNTVDALWQQTGEFRTFLRPADRNDNQNFYPGEALLFWATRLARGQGGDPAGFLRSFAFYREWHRAHRNPAFVPWHTQAYYAALPFVGDDAAQLKDFIFEMNDWLLGMQQWDTAPDPDLRGRFYNPRHPEYGPPHASSTGVYLEGLIDAFDLARREGDTARASRYRLAILRGLRSLMQLQFRDDVDMYYVVKRERVLGGIRTEVYDNAIRVDNVQHGLMAILKILERMSPEELRLVPA